MRMLAIIMLRNVVRSLIASCLLLSTALFAKDSSVLIPEVRVAPKKELQQKTNRGMLITQFNKEDIAISPEVHLTDFLKQEQSIIRLTSNSGDNSETALSIRGFGDNAAANSLLLIDGFPMVNPSLMAPSLNAIALSDIERMDIFQGSKGVLWGDQAVGGVVNIITKRPKLNKPYANIMVANGNENNHSLLLAGGNKYNNGIFVKAYGAMSETDHYRDHNQQRDNNIAFQAGIDYSRGETKVSLQQYHNKINSPGGLSEKQYHDNPRQATNYKNVSYNTTTLLQLLSKFELNAEWVIENRVMHQDTASDGFVFADFVRDNAVNRISPLLIGNLSNAKIRLGYDGQTSKFSLLRKTTFSSTNATQQNIYFHIIVPMNDLFEVTAGARLATQENHVYPIMGQPFHSNDNVFVSEQGLTFYPTHALSFFLRRDGNISFPKANELTLSQGSTSGLSMQTGTSYETGATWKANNNETQINVYRLSLINEIVFNPSETPSLPFGSFHNLSKTQREGITFTDSYRLTPTLLLNSQLNYVDARITEGINSGKKIPAVPSFTGNAGIRYDLAAEWQLKYMLLYTGNRFASEDVHNVGKKVPDYWLHNVALQYIKKNIEVNLEIVNIFDQTYSSYVFYNAFSKVNTYYPGDGRRYDLTFKINLD